MSAGNTKTWPAPCKCSFCFDSKMKQGKFIKPSNMSVKEWKERSGPVHLWDTIWMFFFFTGRKVEKCKVCVNIFTKEGAKNRLFVEPSCSTFPVASVVPPPCASLTSSAAIPSTFCSSPFVWLYSGCPPSVTVWEKSYKQSIGICINKLKLLSLNHLQFLQFNRDL